jgi:eukaryotic-like serine/threonine-protein kinase
MPDGRRFEDRGELGRGGMSVVWRAHDHDIGRDVAMKSVLARVGGGASDELIEEARIVGRLEHPNVVPIYDLVRDPSMSDCRLIMRVVEGRTLAALLGEEPEAPVLGVRLERLLQIFLKVCDAVAFAHSRGVIHSDINPRNVMVGSYGEVYLMDWGLALDRRTDVPATRDDADVGGTPAYMSPEQTRGRLAEIDERTDVYGLGTLLYEFLTLRPPHAAPTGWDSLASARSGVVIAPEDVLPDRMVPAALSAIAMRALAAEPTARHPNVAALRADVEEFVRAGGWFPARRFAAGSVILRDGDTSDVAYIITEGRCEVSRISATGERIRLRVVGPGEIFGEVGLVTGARRLADVHAVTDVTALVVTPAALERELSRTGWVRAFIAAAVARFAELDLAQR